MSEPKPVSLPPRGTTSTTLRRLPPQPKIAPCPSCKADRDVSAPLCPHCGNVSTSKTISLAIKVSLAVLVSNGLILFAVAIALRAIQMANR